MGVWELKYQTRQSEKMLRGCEVVHLGVIGSNIAGISHVHQKPLPPPGSAAVCMERAAGLWMVSKTQPHGHQEPLWPCWPPCQLLVLPVLTTSSVFSGPCCSNINPSEQKLWSSLLNCWYHHTIWFGSSVFLSATCVGKTKN